MTIQTLLEKFCEENDYEFYSSYSGRGMYGANCLGLSHKDDNFTVAIKLAQFIVDFYDDQYEALEMLDNFANPSSDSMGLGRIIYFKHLRKDVEE